jgi:DNA-binding GntR family transcriptional regulator
MSAIDPSIPPDRQTTTDRAYRALKHAIMHGDLVPGQVVSQVELGRQYDVGRTPLREAIRMLQRDGLMDGEANRSVRVSAFSIADVEELYGVRIVNEALGIRLTVPTLDVDDDAFLAGCIEQMASHAAAGDVDAWERIHRAFHVHLVSRSGARLQALLAELYDHAERYRRLYITSEPRAMSIGAHEHEAIVAACRSRDAEAAAAELARHVSRTALTTLMQIAPEHEPATVRTSLRSVLAGAEHSPGASTKTRLNVQ